MTLIVTVAIAFFWWNNHDQDNVIGTQLPEADLLPKDDQLHYGYGVSSDHLLATQIGMKVLEEGGNAVDATIAVAYALGTLEPYASGIGGGGVMIIHPKNEDPIVYDYRTIAPITGPAPKSGVGVPGFVAGMDKVHHDFGSIPFEKLLEPSIELAEKGIEIDQMFQERLTAASDRIPVNELSKFYPNELPLRAGETLIQKELSETLRLIVAEGPEAFYKGKLAENMASKVSGLEVEDFKSYEVKIREPLKGSFYGYDVYAPPAPSSGMMFIQSLQMAEILNIDTVKGNDKDFVHLLGQINRRAHQERKKYIGDPDFVDVPERELLSKENTIKLSSTIDDAETDDQSPLDTPADRDDHANTTHFVIVDKDGMMVSATNTLSNFFGSGIYVDGFFMTNQLRNFSNSKTSPNREDAGKRAASYMVPSILSHDGQPVIGIGSAGGRRIPSVITQALVRAIVYEEPLQDAIDAPRFYLEVSEDVLYIEEQKEWKRMRETSYQMNPSRIRSPFGGVNVLVIDQEDGTVFGGADPRRGGSWESNNGRNDN